MITLGIETSCDETACSVLENGKKIRSNVISSSLAKHKRFGGIVPEIASRHCLEAIDVVYEESLRQARIRPADIDLIAVTQGPGLIGSLLVGVSFAKSLAFSLGRPIIGVHHLKAHLLSNFIGKERKKSEMVGLIVSGGHTSLVHVKGLGFMELGSTVDDALGEAYDKVAKMLGLGYPGGPVIDQFAQGGDSKAYFFTKPKVDGGFDFSFSGVKTAVLHLISGSQIHKGKTIPKRWKGKKLKDLCASFQEAVVGWVVEKTMRACEEKRVKVLAVGGGVSANSRLRSLLQDECRLRGLALHVPPLGLTLDNGAMIAKLGYELYRKGFSSDLSLTAQSSLPF